MSTETGGGRAADRIATSLAPALAGPVADAARLVATRVADGAAEWLGRLGPDRPSRVRRDDGTVDALPATLTHRLLGAVETSLPDTGFGGPAASVLGEAARGEAPGDAAVAVVGAADGHDAFGLPLQVARAVLPHAEELVDALVRALVVQEVVARGLDVPADGPASRIAAAHGRARFALATVVAALVVRAARADLPWLAEHDAPIVVGLGARAAARSLVATPMPDGWGRARLAELRAGFLLPRGSVHSLRADRGRFALVDGEQAAVPDVDAPGNGLVSAVPGGLVVHTGPGGVPVEVTVETTAHGPDTDTDTDTDTGPSSRVDDWDQVVETGYDGTGPARLLGAPHTVWPDPHDLGFPWPGPVRARVHARGRAGGGPESYLVRLWEAAPAPEVVLRDGPVAPSLPAVDATALVRTDFGDRTVWERALDRLRTPDDDGFVASLGVVDDPRFDSATVADLLTLATPSWSERQPCLFVVDAVALASAEIPVLVVGLHDVDRGRTFRVVAARLWAVENNLATANRDFAEFAASASCADPEPLIRTVQRRSSEAPTP